MPSQEAAHENLGIEPNRNICPEKQSQAASRLNSPAQAAPENIEQNTRCIESSAVSPATVAQCPYNPPGMNPSYEKETPFNNRSAMADNGASPVSDSAGKHRLIIEGDNWRT